MHLLHISDTHQRHGLFPQNHFDDLTIVIHSGDCSNYRDPYTNEQEVLNFITWYSSLTVPYKIYVAGNHDTSIEKRLITKKQFERNGIIYLENQSIEIEGLKIYGSPHTPTFGDWAFMKPRDKMHKAWDAIPDDTDILVVHGPPKGILDLSYNRQNDLEYCGCSNLMKRVQQLKLKYCMFGHIHNTKDCYNAGIRTIEGISTIFSNGACVTDGKFDLGLTSFGNRFEL